MYWNVNWWITHHSVTQSSSLVSLVITQFAHQLCMDYSTASILYGLLWF